MLWRRVGILALAVLLAAAVVEAQFGRGFTRARVATAEDFDGQWHYCRLAYRNGFFRGRGGSFTTDFPNADINLSVRLSELTKLSVSKTPRGQPNHLIVMADSDELFQCPLVIMSAPGAASFGDAEVDRLREYLLKGGLLWTDDSWGSNQWESWLYELRKVLPASEYEVFDVPLDHPLFRAQFAIDEIPQIPNIGFWLRSGGQTSEQGYDSAVPMVRGIADAHGRLMVLMTHNTDIADSWEREGEDAGYFYAFSPRGYAFAVNAVLYSMTH